MHKVLSDRNRKYFFRGFQLEFQCDGQFFLFCFVLAFFCHSSVFLFVVLVCRHLERIQRYVMCTVYTLCMYAANWAGCVQQDVDVGRRRDHSEQQTQQKLKREETMRYKYGKIVLSSSLAAQKIDQITKFSKQEFCLVHVKCILAKQ